MRRGGGGEYVTIIIDVHVPAVGCGVVAVGYPVDVAACSDINVVACCVKEVRTLILSCFSLLGLHLSPHLLSDKVKQVIQRPAGERVRLRLLELHSSSAAWRHGST